MQHNLQLGVGEEQDMDCYCSYCWEPCVQDRECLGVSKAPQGHLLAEGNHDSQDASSGTHLSLRARSTWLHFKCSLSI